MVAVVMTACQSGTATKKLIVELKDFSIVPSRLTAQAGTEMTIQLINHGTVEHDFHIMKYGTDIGEMFDEEDEENVLWKIDVPAGETNDQAFLVPNEPGIYQVVCGIPGHVQSGMIGTLEVVE
jgi:uncharacterized cupredoxin-like copper-binding protein